MIDTTRKNAILQYWPLATWLIGLIIQGAVVVNMISGRLTTLEVTQGAMGEQMKVYFAERYTKLDAVKDRELINSLLGRFEDRDRDLERRLQILEEEHRRVVAKGISR